MWHYEGFVKSVTRLPSAYLSDHNSIAIPPTNNNSTPRWKLYER